MMQGATMDLLGFILACSVQGSPAPTALTAAIIQQESSGRPWTLHINKPNRAIYADSHVEAKSQLLQLGPNVDIGLMGVNDRWANILRRSREQLLDPCLNVYTGTWIYANEYARCSRAQNPTVCALSRYNTGSDTAGLGYAQEVLARAQKINPRTRTLDMSYGRSPGTPTATDIVSCASHITFMARAKAAAELADNTAISTESRR